MCVCVCSWLFWPSRCRLSAMQGETVSSFIFIRCLRIICLTSFYSEVVFHYFDYVRVTKSSRCLHLFSFFRDYFLSLTLKKTENIRKKLSSYIMYNLNTCLSWENQKGTVNEILMKSIMHFKLDSFVKKSEIGSF